MSYDPYQADPEPWKPYPTVFSFVPIPALEQSSAPTGPQHSHRALLRPSTGPAVLLDLQVWVGLPLRFPDDMDASELEATFEIYWPRISVGVLQMLSK